MNSKFTTLFTVKNLLIGLLLLVVASCTIYQTRSLNERYGKASPHKRSSVTNHPARIANWNAVQPILNNRCVVCHACWDAPCQLNLGSIEGIDRGASKQPVYDGTRLFAAEPTRLFIDAQTTPQWRNKGFFPVLNERTQTSQANLHASLLYQMLALKKENPLPKSSILPDSFNLSFDRSLSCPTIEEFPSYKSSHPLWGMPYALPKLSAHEYQSLKTWISHGAQSPPYPPITDFQQQQVEQWEQFLNQNSLKHQLMSRYIYEHLFMAHIYFSNDAALGYFNLVRSTTAPGEPINIIATRRPFDNPGVKRVYYRLTPVRSTIVAKSHLPYRWDQARIDRYRSLFLEPEYTVTSLPSYEPEKASNPFITFADIPPRSKYRFMLEEAQFTIMGFIKGPVCRGQIALDVINDQFWIVFVDPDHQLNQSLQTFLKQEANELQLPAANQSNANPLSWFGYAQRQKNYLQAKSKKLKQYEKNNPPPNLDLIWNGDGYNQNAALTIFRHVNSASVVKGFVGKPPKTAWVIDYPLLERIHYLLVAGFDVYGNAGHQLNTRLYMDFLRMEGESNFLQLLPKEDRISIRNYWYRDTRDSVKEYVYGKYTATNLLSGIQYHSDKPQQELYQLLEAYLSSVLNHRYSLKQLNDPSLEKQLMDLQNIAGDSISILPEVTFLTVKNSNKPLTNLTLIHNDAHSNISGLLMEERRRLPQEDTLTVAFGFIGAYPNAFLSVEENQLDELISAVKNLKVEANYSSLLSEFGIRRTSSRFWPHSDYIQASHLSLDPVSGGLFDYNRLENR